MSNVKQLFYGTIIHSLSLDKLHIIKNGLLGVDGDGKIVSLQENVETEELDSILEGLAEDSKLIRLSEWQFIMPGFIDTHTHAPQYANAGTGMDLPLLEWLEKYTFPLEHSFSSTEFAAKIYPRFVSHLLRNGTTTAVYYATIHLESSKYLAETVKGSGQRGFIGKVNMDRNSPEYYVENSNDSVLHTEEFVKYVLDLDAGQNLVQPIVTPRFAITCTEKLMTALADIAAKYDVPIQSHLSENTAEIAFVSELFPDIKDYTSVYDHHKLLNHKTIMAHGVHLTDDERDLLKQRNVGISHCPNSNLALRSGVCKVRQLLQDGIKVGLGTDISGGGSKSILDAMRRASATSRVVAMTDGNGEHLKLSELVFLATMGGAELVNLQDTVGNFKVGKDFDALLIDPCAEGSPIDVFDMDDTERVFEKFIFLGDDRNIIDVFVKGRRVSGI